ACDRDSDEHVHGDVRDRPHAGLDCELEGNTRERSRPHLPAAPGLYRGGTAYVRAGEEELIRKRGWGWGKDLHRLGSTFIALVQLRMGPPGVFGGSFFWSKGGVKKRMPPILLDGTLAQR